MVENIFVKKKSLQVLLSSLNAVISTNERNWILAGHVIFKLRYNQIYQLKTLVIMSKQFTYFNKDRSKNKWLTFPKGQVVNITYYQIS